AGADAEGRWAARPDGGAGHGRERAGFRHPWRIRRSEDVLMTLKDLSQLSLKDVSQQVGSHLPERDDVLGWIGLQQRAANDTAFTMLAPFALRTLAAAPLALPFPPKPR